MSIEYPKYGRRGASYYHILSDVDNLKAHKLYEVSFFKLEYIV